MSFKKKYIPLLFISLCNSALADGVVFDPSVFAQQLQQVAAWGRQYQQMQQQYQQIQQQFQSANGLRNMGDLVNNPTLRQYLPANPQSLINGSYGNSDAIYNANTVQGITTNIDPNSDTYKSFVRNGRQLATNQAAFEAAYTNASNNIANIQVLLDQINQSPDGKDIADLQARIQAEQAMLQNESNKLAMLTQMTQAQKDLAAHKANELQMMSTRGNPAPRF